MMRNPHFCCHKMGGERIHHKHPHNKKNSGNDQEQLLFELFKLYLRSRRGEQGQNHQEEPPQGQQQCRETGEAEIIEISNENNGCGDSCGPRKHCHKFGGFKKANHHNKHWGKNHHGHHKKMHHHKMHQHHHGMHHHGINHHGMHHHGNNC